MCFKLFNRPLDRQAVTDIADYFPEFKNVSDIQFETEDDLRAGCFSLQISLRDAKMLSDRYGICLIIEKDRAHLTGNPLSLWEYVMRFIEVPSDMAIVSVWECLGVWGLAREAMSYTNTQYEKGNFIFPILIPRLDNKRENLVGIVVSKAGKEMRIEFKRVGKVIPVLN